jgi:hypothetical protein
MKSPGRGRQEADAKRAAGVRGKGTRTEAAVDIPNRGEVVLFGAPDGSVRLDVRLEQETVWLTQAQMVELLGRDQSVISRHLRNLFRGVNCR